MPSKVRQLPQAELHHLTSSLNVVVLVPRNEPRIASTWRGSQPEVCGCRCAEPGVHAPGNRWASRRLRSVDPEFGGVASHNRRGPNCGDVLSKLPENFIRPRLHHLDYFCVGTILLPRT